MGALGLALYSALLILTSCGSVSSVGTPKGGASSYVFKLGSVDTGNGKLSFLTVFKPVSKGMERAILLFPGGDGTCHFGNVGSFCAKERNYLNGNVWVSNNFLARNVIKFAQGGDLVVLVGMPEKIKEKLDGANAKTVASAYRVSEEHYRDVRDLIAHLKSAFSVEEFVLVGTSRGTLSVAYLSGKLPEVSTVVLTATVSSDPRFGEYCPSQAIGFLSCTGFESTSKRVLFVHHRLDSCGASSFTSARRVFDNLVVNPPGVKHFKEFYGGSEPAYNPCGGRTNHGFYGIDKEVVDYILGWIG